MHRLIDVSSHNLINKEQWKLLATVLHAVVIRLSFGVTKDSKAQQHIDDASEVGLPFAGYHWVDPTWDFYRQFSAIQEVVGIYKPLGMMLDHEQWWTDWDAYMKQDLAKAYKTKLTSKQINDFSLKTYTWCRQYLGVPVLNYSADWFMNEYCPELRSWIMTKKYIEARYLRYYDANWWAAKKNELGVPFDIKHIREISRYAGVKNGIGRQYESLIPVKGLEAGMDYHLDWINMRDKPFYNIFGGA